MDYFSISSVIILIITLVVFKVIRTYRYFESNGVPAPKEIPFLGYFGYYFLKKIHVIDCMRNLYNEYKDAKYFGSHMFLDSLIIVRDLDLIKCVLVKNFDHFADHKTFVDEADDPLFGKNLAFKNGQRWREVRNLLSPSFTSSKMRTMFVLMSNCAESFVDKLMNKYRDADSIDMKDLFTKYANDVIATCAFGIEVDTLNDPQNEFYVRGRRSTNFAAFKKAELMLLMIFPWLYRKLGMRFINKEDTDFFVKLIGDAIKIREEQGIVRPDMLQLMIDAREKGDDLDLLEITAQAFIFFLGGFETTSGQMCMMVYELATRSDIQKKLQDEIDEMMENCNGKPTYEAVNNLPYLDALFSETLRMHPLPNLSRICSKEFELPPAVPGGKPFMVKPGMELWIPIVGIHYDANCFENPNEFDPDRFLNHPNKKAVTTDVTSLGFGLGPRVCIGNRFAILETKVLLVYLLAKCNIVPCEKTCIPLEYDINSFQPAVKGGCWLNLKPRA